MKVHFVDCLPQISRKSRSLYVDLMNNPDEVVKTIEKISVLLANVQSGNASVTVKDAPVPIIRATHQMIEERINELKGGHVSFRTTQIGSSCSSQECLDAIEGLSIHLESIGIHYLCAGEIDIKNFCKVLYDDSGLIIKTVPDLGLGGLNTLELIAGFCQQDFGLVFERNSNLIYIYGSARYEKTPKHVDSGYDYFLDEDFLEWHKRIPKWGNILANLFEKLYQSFQDDQLDLFIVDLKGRNTYTNGKVTVQRYERDYAMPLRNRKAETKGMIVFADSLFKNISEAPHTFTKGKYLKIDSPRAFHQSFHIIKSEKFTHHPFGIRDLSGKLPVKHKAIFARD